MIFDELDRVLRTDPSAPAIMRAGRRGRPVVQATRGALAALADGYAAGLHARGLVAGDTIGVAVRPGPRALAVMLAARRLGLCAAVLDPSAGPDVLLARLALAQPKLVLADAAAQAVAGWARPIARRVQLELPELAALAPVATVGPRLPGCARPLTAGSAPAPCANVDPGSAAVIVFTSGTTSKPRAVVHTWASLNAGMRTVTELVRPVSQEVVLGGMFFVLVPSLAAGAAVALPSRTPEVLVRQLRRLQPQHTYLTPPQLRAVLAAGGSFSGQVFSGSAPVSAGLLGRVRAAGAVRAYGVYALTEIFPVAVVEATAKAAYSGEGDLVGELAPGVEARVDGSGQLLLAGPSACARYLDGHSLDGHSLAEPSLGEPSLVEPPLDWIPTGDIGRIGADGQVILGGRCKDMILRGAENIYPGLYEPSLHVPGVNLALLVGVPAADGDERLVAVVEPAPGADPAAVRAALREPLRRMGAARPDSVLLAQVPVAGRSRKPDRAATARLAVSQLNGSGREAEPAR